MAYQGKTPVYSYDKQRGGRKRSKNRRRKNPKQQRNRRILTIVLSIILVAAIVFLIAFGVKRHNDNKTEQTKTATQTTQSAETTKPVPQNTAANRFASIKEGYNLPYAIAVNTAQNIVIVYQKDPATGSYTKPVKAMTCSTGVDNQTISWLKTYDKDGSGYYKNGLTYTVGNTNDWWELEGKVYGQYAMRISSHILFHTVPYTVKGDSSSLQEGEYDKLGTAASHGCIRLTVADMQWLQKHCTAGTCVSVYSDAKVKEPLAKPAVQKIGNIGTNDPRHGWDPTDPNPKNPWNTTK